MSLGDLLGPLFMTNLHFFSEDRFHPSAAGYFEAAQAVLPSCLDALGLHTRTRSASTFTTQRVKSAKKAAAQAVARPGTEVSGAERFGRSEGRARPVRQVAPPAPAAPARGLARDGHAGIDRPGHVSSVPRHLTGRGGGGNIGVTPVTR